MSEKLRQVEAPVYTTVTNGFSTLARQSLQIFYLSATEL